MASNFELNIPEQATPTKINMNSDSLLLSPSSVKSTGDEAAIMITTGGVPIASLTTPTKSTAPANIAPKQPISITPSKLFLKQSVVGTSQIKQTSIAQLICSVPSSSMGGSPAAPVYQAIGNTANGKVQYVRLVTSQGDGSNTAPTRQIITTQVRQTPGPAVANGSSHRQQNIHLQQQQQQQLNPAHATSQTGANRYTTTTGNMGQRVLLPAGTPQTIRISGSQSLAQIKSQLPPGTTILSSGDTMGQMLAFLPTNHTVLQQRMPALKQMYPGAGQALVRSQEIKTEPLPQPPQISNVPSVTQQSGVTSTAASSDNKQKKPCNCTKSQCLKLYCDCFANGEFCSNCNCQNCYNNLEHEEDRQKAVRQCLERNPQAFHPKIGKGAKADARRHQKGCNCKRSGCLKNYCECYEAKIPCGSMCKCVGCKNCEGSDSKSLMYLADAADMRYSQLSAANHRQSHDLRSPTPDTQLPHTYLKKGVIEAVMDCLIAQCREAESAKCNDSTTEKVILEEYGRCLAELIKTSSQAKRL